MIGLDINGVEESRATIQITKRPASILTHSDKVEMSKDKGWAQVEITLVDEDGLPVVFSDNEINCMLKGPAKLRGLEADDMTDMENYRDKKKRVCKGKMIAYSQVTEEVVEVVFTFPWLEASICLIRVK